MINRAMTAIKVYEEVTGTEFSYASRTIRNQICEIIDELQSIYKVDFGYSFIESISSQTHGSGFKKFSFELNEELEALKIHNPKSSIIITPELNETVHRFKVDYNLRKASEENKDEKIVRLENELRRINLELEELQCINSELQLKTLIKDRINA